MNLESIKTPEEIELFTLNWLDKISDLKLGLSADDSKYDLVFVGEKLAICSYAQEMVSDGMMQLTRVSIEVMKVSHARANDLRLKELRVKGSTEYEVQPRDQKTLWLQNQLEPLREVVETWNGVRRLVSEVKEAISQRAQDLKRLDSDLRLHSKLLDAKLAAGAAGKGTPPTRPEGGASSGELDID